MRSIGHSTSFPGLEQLPDGGRLYYWAFEVNREAVLAPLL
jgi:hypothetical protein